MAWIVTFVLSGILVGFTKIETKEVIRTVPIVSLDRSNTTTGHFTLGTGTISNQVKYFYYTKTKDGGYRLDSINADSTTLYEDDREDGVIAVRSKTEIPEKSWWQFTFMNCEEFTKYELHVPKNTIRREFKG